MVGREGQQQRGCVFFVVAGLIWADRGSMWCYMLLRYLPKLRGGEGTLLVAEGEAKKWEFGANCE